MSDKRDDDKREHPGEQVREGLGLLWRAARGVAVGVKKEMNRTELGRSFQDAGRELARAATNVVGRIAEEVTKTTARPAGHVQDPPPGSDEARPKDTKAKEE